MIDCSNTHVQENMLIACIMVWECVGVCGSVCSSNAAPCESGRALLKGLIMSAIWFRTALFCHTAQSVSTG